MNAINHAATALILKRRWPDLPLVPALVSVQLVELLWVFLNLAGVERTATAPQVQSLADIHLEHMPYSHSVASTVLLAAIVWAVLSRTSRWRSWALPLAAGVASHIVLDLATHAADIELIPFFFPVKLGSGLYDVPVWALLVETPYGILCWWVFRGSRALLAVIVAFDAGAISFYVPAIPGPEALLAGHPKVFAGVILVHIVAALLAVFYFAGKDARRNRGGISAV